MCPINLHLYFLSWPKYFSWCQFFIEFLISAVQIFMDNFVTLYLFRYIRNKILLGNTESTSKYQYICGFLWSERSGVIFRPRLPHIIVICNSSGRMSLLLFYLINLFHHQIKRESILLWDSSIRSRPHRRGIRSPRVEGGENDKIGRNNRTGYDVLFTSKRSVLKYVKPVTLPFPPLGSSSKLVGKELSSLLKTLYVEIH